MDIDNDLYLLLEEKTTLYNQPLFIETDPIQVPRQFSDKNNIEIAGFLSATIAWGKRPMIIKNALKMVQLMDNDPFDFIMNSNEKDWQHFVDFKHRTFNAIDVIYFMKSLQNIYQNHGGLENVFNEGYQFDSTVYSALKHFRQVFFELDFPQRTQKHLSNVEKNSSAKRLNMFLRWMVRKDNSGVDFGIWKQISPSSLMLPLDVHTGNIGRQLGLLQRKQNDWKAVNELTEKLRLFDAEDPVKYDFALFGIGVFENK